MFNRSLIEDALPASSRTAVAHYTRIGTLCSFISNRTSGWSSAWATPVQFLNDRMELSLGLEVFRDVANTVPQSGQRIVSILNDLFTTFGRIETDAFQMSFSGNPDELGQWRGYAANGLGCSIVTDAAAIKNVADVAGWVIYDLKTQRRFAYEILRQLSNEKDDELIEKTLTAAACYMKHKGFRPEMEYRLLKFPLPEQVKFRESGDRLVPYIDYLNGTTPLPVRRIIIGPGWQLSKLESAELARNHVVQGIHRLLSAHKMHNTPIASSTIPYDPK